jgi:methionine synthase II (cobalamin-independent)
LKRSTNRILTTHPGRLPDPDNYAEIMDARRAGDQQKFDELAQAAIQDLVRRQREIRLDIRAMASSGRFATSGTTTIGAVACWCVHSNRVSRHRVS